MRTPGSIHPHRGAAPRLLFALGCAIVAAACGGGGAPSLPGGASAGGGASATGPIPVIPASARKEAAELYAVRCATCHGPQGGGDGPAAAGLRPKPKSFRQKGWQGSVSDAHIETAIVFGGAAVGKSAVMPGNPDLKDRPAVVAALRAYVRSLAPADRVD
jgi:mono/diheme cytochrome c family protein